MKTYVVFAAAVLLAANAASAQNRVPILLELFTSEGCSSCPPADAFLQSLDRQPIAGADLIVISEHVDYWNHLGWSDPFSSAFYSQRQRNYATLLKGDDVYTPQLVVDGTKGLVGSSRGEAASAIKDSLTKSKLPFDVTAERAGNKATVHIAAPSAPNGHKADVYVVLASDRASSQVSGGENAGRSLTHVAVAYSFTKAASWQTNSSLAHDVQVELKAGVPKGETRIIAFAQDRETGRVLAVSQVKL